jgi:hypothetical protein
MDGKLLSVLKQSFWEKLLNITTVVYIDTHDHFLDKEFINYKVRSQFRLKTDNRYHLRILRIPIKLLEEFKTATINVRNKALVCGYTQFDDVFNQAKKMINEK